MFRQETYLVWVGQKNTWCGLTTDKTTNVLKWCHFLSVCNYNVYCGSLRKGDVMRGNECVFGGCSGRAVLCLCKILQCNTSHYNADVCTMKNQ